MDKINGWNEVNGKNPGEFEKLPAGGQVCRIMNAVHGESKSGRGMLTLCLDVATGEYAGFYKKLYDGDDRADKKWPCKYYQLTDGDSLSFFKGLITSIEKSNSGYVWSFDEKLLIGKLIGFVFGEEEYEKQDGSIGTSVKPFFPRSVEEIEKGVDIPKPKTLSASGSKSKHSGTPSDSDLPF